ncbi:MAG: nucleotidyltransferase family protein, partial [Thermoflexales bacterium]
MKQIQRDLFELTEALCETAARALGASSGAAPKLVWTDRRSRLAAMVAHVHGIGPLLDSVEWDAPDPLRAELRLQAAGSRARAVRLLAVRDRFVASMRASGCEPIALKGAAHAETLYASPGLRPMADLDFLIAEADGEACDRAALSAGLARSSASDRHIVYVLEPARIVALLREDPGNPIKLEIHRRLAETFWGVAFDVTDAFRRADRAVGDSLHSLLHCSHHASVRTLRFCQVADLAQLLANLAPRDLESLAAALRACGGMGWAHAPLKLVDRYFPGVVDGGLVAETARAAPALARRARRWTISELS